MTYAFMILLFLLALFLILLILVQRGKGGGLAGAFGGMGGQSAFGTKAGDTFTRITIGVAFVWIILCLLSVRMLETPQSQLDLDKSPDPSGGIEATSSGEGTDAAPATGGAGGESGTSGGNSGTGGE